MLRMSVLKSISQSSPMKGSSLLNPQATKKRRSFVFPLMLTSLIDAFSILVIYLLVNFSAADQTVQLAQKVNLPSSKSNEEMKSGTVVSFDHGRYLVDNREVALKDLPRKLASVKEKKAIIVEADKAADYAALNPIILAGSQVGFQEFRFAVIQGGSR